MEAEPGILSVVPAALAIVLAFLTRRVLPALFLGIVAGGVVLWHQTGDPADLNFLRRFLIPALGTTSYAKILLIYLWCLGGLIGIWERTGAALHFAEVVGRRVAHGPRSSRLFAWIVGVVFHQGGTVSTVLAGTTVKPVTDRHRVSHEELSYIVDSTASPVATILPFNAWPAYVAGLAAGTVPLLPDEDAGVDFFFRSVPFNFYGWFAVLSTLLFALGWLPWTGRRMAAAIERARTTGQLDAPGAQPMLQLGEVQDRRAAGYTPHLVDFLGPLGVLIGLAVVPYALGQLGVLEDGNWINEAFMACTLTAILLARARGMRLAEVLDGFIEGCKGMTIGAIILGLAVTLGLVARELHTATYLVGLVGDSFPPVALPAALTLLCLAIAFACRARWGTYAVVLPVALPVAWALQPDPTYLSICFGAVIGGAVFGDQCSPVSDTTILSSMFTGCDLMDHVATQLPLALAAAGLGAVASTLAAVLLV